MKKVEMLIALVLLCIFIVFAGFKKKIISSMDPPVKQESSNLEESSKIEESSVAEEDSMQESSSEESSNVPIDVKTLEFKASDVSYLDDAVFIGDSRTQGLQLGTGLTAPRFLAERGLSVDKVGTEALFQLSDGTVGTVYDVLSEQTYGKVYLMFGVNELGWVYPEVFIDHFRKIVQTVHTLQPDAIVYVQGIIPVTAAKSGDGDVYTNEKINEWNPKIQQMAEEENCVYLDPGTALRNEDGVLPADAASDGVHLTAEYCQDWLDYLLQHTK